jgi:hypothetical protein
MSPVHKTSAGFERFVDPFCGYRHGGLPVRLIFGEKVKKAAHIFLLALAHKEPYRSLIAINTVQLRIEQSAAQGRCVKHKLCALMGFIYCGVIYHFQISIA